MHTDKAHCASEAIRQFEREQIPVGIRTVGVRVLSAAEYKGTVVPLIFGSQHQVTGQVPSNTSCDNF